MRINELNELIKKYGNVKFLEIRDELKKLGYACNVPAVTIFIVTNDDNVILNAFTSMEDAKRYIDIKYSILPEKFNIEPCALNVDVEFIKELKI